MLSVLTVESPRRNTYCTYRNGGVSVPLLVEIFVQSGIPVYSLGKCIPTSLSNNCNIPQDHGNMAYSFSLPSISTDDQVFRDVISTAIVATVPFASRSVLGPTSPHHLRGPILKGCLFFGAHRRTLRPAVARKLLLRDIFRVGSVESC